MKNQNTALRWYSRTPLKLRQLVHLDLRHEKGALHLDLCFFFSQKQPVGTAHPTMRRAGASDAPSPKPDAAEGLIHQFEHDLEPYHVQKTTFNDKDSTVAECSRIVFLVLGFTQV